MERANSISLLQRLDRTSFANALSRAIDDEMVLATRMPSVMLSVVVQPDVEGVGPVGVTDWVVTCASTFEEVGLGEGTLIGCGVIEYSWRPGESNATSANTALIIPAIQDARSSLGRSIWS